MSIFYEQHHDKSLLEHLSIDDIARLSQVNRYYYNLTKDKLAPFREFFETKDTLCEKIYYGLYYIKMNIQTNNEVDTNLKLTIQAHLYGNLDVIKYITRNSHLQSVTKVPIQKFRRSKVPLYKDYQYLDTILTMIAITKSRIDVLLYLKDLYGFRNIDVPIYAKYLGDTSETILNILINGDVYLHYSAKN